VALGAVRFGLPLSDRLAPGLGVQSFLQKRPPEFRQTGEPPSLRPFVPQKEGEPLRLRVRHSPAPLRVELGRAVA
jgi:hypothetical protein